MNKTMSVEVRDSLRASIIGMKDRYKMNTSTMQNTTGLKDIGCPVSWRTLYKIEKKDDYLSMSIPKQSALLTFFLTPHKRIFGVVELTKIEDNV